MNIGVNKIKRNKFFFNFEKITEKNYLDLIQFFQKKKSFKSKLIDSKFWLKTYVHGLFNFICKCSRRVHAMFTTIFECSRRVYGQLQMFTPCSRLIANVHVVFTADCKCSRRVQGQLQMFTPCSLQFSRVHANVPAFTSRSRLFLLFPHVPACSRA